MSHGCVPVGAGTRRVMSLTVGIVLGETENGNRFVATRRQ
jgi:hypothetical protein